MRAKVSSDNLPVIVRVKQFCGKSSPFPTAAPFESKRRWPGVTLKCVGKAGSDLRSAKGHPIAISWDLHGLSREFGDVWSLGSTPAW